MKSLGQLFFACGLLPLLWLSAMGQPSHQAGIGLPTQSRIEAESAPAAQAGAAVVEGGTGSGNAALAPDSGVGASSAPAGKGAGEGAYATAGAADRTDANNGEAIDARGDADTGEESTSMQSDPLMIVIITLAAAYIFHLWLQDYRANQAGTPNKGAFPGATSAGGKAIIIAIVGALILLAAETAGEMALGISAEQSDMTVLMLFSITAAAFFEELIFRGYLVISNKGRALLIGSILGFSVLFALIHPFLWDITTPENVPGWQIWNATWEFHFDSTKAWFSTIFVLVNSLWFYAMRFAPFNPARSLVPCIAAHLAMNWGVFLVKLAQGHVTALF